MGATPGLVLCVPDVLDVEARSLPANVTDESINLSRKGSVHDTGLPEVLPLRIDNACVHHILMTTMMLLYQILCVACDAIKQYEVSRTLWAS